MNRLIIVGSPRPNGRSAALADLLFEACIAECPDDEVALAPVSTLSIAPCEGCDACRELEERRGRTIEGAPAGDGADHCDPIRCIIDDDMAEIYPLIDAADELIVVSPVYFAGAPAQLKALLDRLQPYFWTDARRLSKRPAILHVVGEGGDPHGFDPLVGVVRSALSCAGFRLERVLDWVGRINADGEITADAIEHPLPPLPGDTASSAPGPANDAPRSVPQAECKVKSERPVLHVAETEPFTPDGGSKKASGGSGHPHGSGQPATKKNRSAQGGGRNQARSAQGGGSKQTRSAQGGGSKSSRPKKNGSRRG